MTDILYPNEILASPVLFYVGVSIMGIIAVAVTLVAGGYLIRKLRERKWGWCRCIADLYGKVIVITGANSGIGLETARGLAEKGATVVLACRNADTTRKAIATLQTKVTKGQLIYMQLDLADQDSIRAFVTQFLTKYQKLDVLINNAGIYHPPQQPPLTDKHGNELHFAVNHLGHFLLTHLLMDVLVASSSPRIVIVSSELYPKARLDFDDLFSGTSGRSAKTEDTTSSTQNLVLPKGRDASMLLYSNSKLANLLHARELHQRYKARGVHVMALSPGFTYTGLFRHSLNSYACLKKMAFLPIAFFFMRSARQGAQSSIHCTCSSKVQLNGLSDGVAYYQNCKAKPLLPVAEDDGMAHRLWELSMRLLELN